MAMADWSEFCSLLLYFNLALQSPNCVIKLHHMCPIHNQQDAMQAQERVLCAGPGFTQLGHLLLYLRLLNLPVPGTQTDSISESSPCVAILICKEVLQKYVTLYAKGKYFPWQTQCKVFAEKKKD